MTAGNEITARRQIERYEAVAAISRDMRAAATAGDRGRFEQLIRQCRDEIADVQSAGGPQALARAERPRRIELLQGILADDAEIRRRAEPALERIEQWLAAARRPG